MEGREMKKTFKWNDSLLTHDSIGSIDIPGINLPNTFWFCIVVVVADKENPNRWFNAFEGQKRQAIGIKYGNEKPFYIDNEDGSGLLKLNSGGHNELFHRGLPDGSFVIDSGIYYEPAWKTFDIVKYNQIELAIKKHMNKQS